ncbi:MAG: (2Fe-2S) ferredoxin domain-containing protein [Anaerolineaceae bacterium]|jgi:NADP-reducing hydrogenase subunit HndB|nr:(2Fe-2S) ferredoxin domain-containing protein [Anaerolineaceae bacterium]
MPAIKSIEDLKRIRDEALKKQEMKSASGQKQIIVGMGTCGIAAGARDTMKAILEKIEKDNLGGIIVTQTGCIGICEMEPIVQVQIGEEPKVTYGKVTQDVAARIIDEHVLSGNIVKENMVSI